MCRARQESEPSRAEQLALLYQGMLTAIVRIQSGKQPLIDANAFQKRMESLLDEIEREAIKVGYRNQDIQDAHYAIIAFLDETVQRSSDANRNQWTPLQAKRYAQAVAGEGVYERLKTIRTRRDSRELADLLEVYDLCFLLGYQGRYAVGGRSELDRLIEDLREQIERIRGHQAVLSPEGPLPERERPGGHECVRSARAGLQLAGRVLNAPRPHTGLGSPVESKDHRPPTGPPVLWSSAACESF